MALIELQYDLRNPATGEPSPLRPHQYEYWVNCRKYRYCLAGGDWSSGKTAVNLYRVAECMVTALAANIYQKRHDPYSIVLVHKKLDWARTALLEPLKAILPSAQSSDWFRNTGDENRVRYGHKDNHVLLDWIGLDTTAVDPAEFKRSSKNYDLACVSQGDILQEEVLWAIDARLGRKPLPAPLIAQQLWDSNATKNFLYRIFLKRQVEKPERFYCQLSDVESMGDLLSQAFRETMANRSEAQKRSARDWDYAPGAAFVEYDPRISWVKFDDVPFARIPKMKEAMDWGFALHPAAYVWYGVDYEGNVWFFDELEMYRHDAPMQYEAVKRKRDTLIAEWSRRMNNPVHDQQKMYAGTFGGPDLNQTDGSSTQGKTKGDQLKTSGLKVKIINPDVPGRYNQDESKVTEFASALRVDLNRTHPVTGKKGASRIYITEQCERLSEQISQAMSDPDNPKTLDDGPIKNRFELEDDRVHHWDLLQAAMIALQEVKKPVLVEPAIKQELQPNEVRETRLTAILNRKPRRI